MPFSLGRSMKKCITFRWAFAALFSFGTMSLPQAQAGIMVDGRVATYETLAQQSQFDSIGRFVEGGSGTLIAPNWVLTVGHVGAVNNFQVRGTGTQYSVAEIIRHPTFLANGSNLGFGFDVALVRLNTAVVGVAPASIYRGSGDIGQLATITGFGLGGIGSVGALDLPAIQRAGTNVIDSVFNFNNGTSGQVGAQNSAFVTDFDGPSQFGIGNTIGSATVTSHEYQLASGDSGGGLFIFENGEWKLAGINSGIASQSQVLGSGNTNNLGYGAISVFTRVTSFQGYIDGITAVPEPSSFGLASLAAATLLLVAARRRKANRQSLS